MAALSQRTGVSFGTCVNIGLHLFLLREPLHACSLPAVDAPRKTQLEREGVLQVETGPLEIGRTAGPQLQKLSGRFFGGQLRTISAVEGESNRNMQSGKG